MPELRLSHGTVPYDVLRRSRRTVGVVVRPDGRVEVHAPRRTSEQDIRVVVEELRTWIEKKRREVLERRRRRVERRFEHGDEIPFLGGKLRLSVVESRSAPPPAVREGDSLVVTVALELTPAARRAAVRHATQHWLLEESREIFHRRHVAMGRIVGETARRVVIKDMRTRWGSCGPDRLMNLNWRLVLAPERIVDYVLVHELSHIFEPNHSPAFWKRVGRACADYKESRRWLRAHGDELEL